MEKGKSVGVGKFVTDKERSTKHQNKMDKALPKKPEVVHLHEQQAGFTVLSRRCVVERTFG